MAVALISVKPFAINQPEENANGVPHRISTRKGD